MKKIYRLSIRCPECHGTRIKLWARDGQGRRLRCPRCKGTGWSFKKVDQNHFYWVGKDEGKPCPF